MLLRQTCNFFLFSISTFSLSFSNFNSFSRVLIFNVASANNFLLPASSFSTFSSFKLSNLVFKSLSFCNRLSICSLHFFSKILFSCIFESINFILFSALFNDVCIFKCNSSRFSNSSSNVLIKEHFSSSSFTKGCVAFKVSCNEFSLLLSDSSNLLIKISKLMLNYQLGSFFLLISNNDINVSINTNLYLFMVFNDSFSATRSFLIMLFNVRCCLLNFSPSSLSSLISESLSSIRTLNCALVGIFSPLLLIFDKYYLFISELLAANSAFFLLKSIIFDSLDLTIKMMVYGPDDILLGYVDEMHCFHCQACGDGSRCSFIDVLSIVLSTMVSVTFINVFIKYLPSSQLLFSKVVSDTFNKSIDELLVFNVFILFILFWVFFTLSKDSIITLFLLELGDANSVKEVSNDEVVDFSSNIPPCCGIKVSSLAIQVTLSDIEQVRLSSSSINSGIGSIVSVITAKTSTELDVMTSIDDDSGVVVDVDPRISTLSVDIVDLRSLSQLTAERRLVLLKLVLLVLRTTSVFDSESISITLNCSSCVDGDCPVDLAATSSSFSNTELLLVLGYFITLIFIFNIQSFINSLLCFFKSRLCKTCKPRRIKLIKPTHILLLNVCLLKGDFFGHSIYFITIKSNI
ncbi:hypothetical protein AGLY_016002 [Aphis glycines]|uniref:Uncharacterized protein n=1 Tax=Aphis glycines TaxID=307491 RepID=A0A6G0SYH4_APHGL|nr:hypothetical protein AGLY_016002 [Aphis glycines]